jgi:hypothetical protein
MRDLFADNGGSTDAVAPTHTEAKARPYVPGPRPAGVPEGADEHAFDYRSADGTVVYRKIRWDWRMPDGQKDKTCRFIRPDARSETGWVWGRGDVPRVPYGLDRFAKSKWTIHVEGELKAEALWQMGFPATTVGGARDWEDRLAEHYRDFERVLTLPDNDGPGREHVEEVAASLEARGIKVFTLDLPGIPEHGDVVDWIAAGGTAEQLRRLLSEAAREVLPSTEPTGRSAVDAKAGAQVRTPAADSGPAWPDPPHPAAFTGLAGEFVRAIEPHTEADGVAILSQILVAYGSVIGRSAWWSVERDRHYGNIYVALVGETSKARKGTSWGHARYLFESIDAYWAANRVASGLSSGEGLIAEVGDSVITCKDGEETVVEEGVSDKRLLVVEPELASALRVMRRETNILAQILRAAWDTGNLRTLVRHSPVRASGAHVSLIGHITKPELLSTIDETEHYGGTANRILWLAVKRSKSLPYGGRLSQVDFAPLLRRLKAVVEFGRQGGEFLRDREADRMWETVYDSLSEGRPGLVGAATSRGEAQVMRLALLYALLDESGQVRAKHLLAGLALWDYAERSAQFIFGATANLGDPVANKIFSQLRNVAPEGLSRTGISGLFGRNKPGELIELALRRLEKDGLVRVRAIKTSGRPEERWAWTGKRPALPPASVTRYLSSFGSFASFVSPGSSEGTSLPEMTYERNESNEERFAWSSASGTGEGTKETKELEKGPEDLAGGDSDDFAKEERSAIQEYGG